MTRVAERSQRTYRLKNDGETLYWDLLSECSVIQSRAETVNSGSAEPDRVNTREGNKSNHLASNFGCFAAHL